MPLEATRAAHDHADGPIHGHHGGPAAPLSPPSDLLAVPAAQGAAGGPSPLWWSASKRLAWAALLGAALWAVIAWAVA